MEENKTTNNEIQVELSDEMAQGTYANLAIISHSASEFILDFIRVVPGAPKAQVKSRIILTPDNAHRLYLALQDNLRKFEEMMTAGKAKAENKTAVLIYDNVPQYTPLDSQVHQGPQEIPVGQLPGKLFIPGRDPQAFKGRVLQLLLVGWKKTDNLPFCPWEAAGENVSHRRQRARNALENCLLI